MINLSVLVCTCHCNKEWNRSPFCSAVSPAHRSPQPTTNSYISAFPFPRKLLLNQWKIAIAGSSIYCNITVSLIFLWWTTTAILPKKQTQDCAFKLSQRNCVKHGWYRCDFMSELLNKCMYIFKKLVENKCNADFQWPNYCNRSTFDSVTGLWVLWLEDQSLH